MLKTPESNSLDDFKKKVPMNMGFRTLNTSLQNYGPSKLKKNKRFLWLSFSLSFNWIIMLTTNLVKLLLVKAYILCKEAFPDSCS